MSGNFLVSERANYSKKCRDFIAKLNAQGGAGSSQRSNILVQTSSGSWGSAMIVPRRAADIADIFARASRYFVRRHGHLPERVAMLGGISHLEVARHLTIDHVEIVSLNFDDLTALEDFSPDVICCYPSVLRCLCAESELRLPNLKTIKVGGERVFRADINKTFSRFPNVQLLEQHGSTEMPAVAFRDHSAQVANPFFELETQRFQFAAPGGDGWHELLVQDLRDDLAVRPDGYYRMGDDALFRQGNVFDIRRSGDVCNRYFGILERLFTAGCINVQFDLAAERLSYVGEVEIPRNFRADGRWFQTVRVDRIERLSPSNKLQLVRC